MIYTFGELKNNTKKNNSMSLHELGLKHKTDKAHYHNFTHIYDERLKNLIDEPINFLEIGVEHGYSLKMWCEYFKKAKIFGADILDKSFMDDERIKTFKINQENEKDLTLLPKNLDVIVDDGGHTMLQQQLTFKIVFDRNLKSGGVFILEDLHTSKERYYTTHGSNDKNNTLKLLFDLKNKKISEDNQYFITKLEFDKLLSQIESIDIYEIGDDSITSIIIKK
jgi:hypothetical protein